MPSEVRERLEAVLIKQDEECNLISTTGDYMKVVDLILSVIWEMVKERKKEFGKDYDKDSNSDYNYVLGYNQSLTDLRARLEGK